MKNRKAEIGTIVMFGALLVMSFVALGSSKILNTKNTTSTKAAALNCKTITNNTKALQITSGTCPIGYSHYALTDDYENFNYTCCVPKSASIVTASSSNSLTTTSIKTSCKIGDKCGSGNAYSCTSDNGCDPDICSQPNLEFACCVENPGEYFNCNETEDSFSWYGCIGQPCENTKINNRLGNLVSCKKYSINKTNQGPVCLPIDGIENINNDIEDIDSVGFPYEGCLNATSKTSCLQGCGRAQFNINGVLYSTTGYSCTADLETNEKKWCCPNTEISEEPIIAEGDDNNVSQITNDVLTDEESERKCTTTRNVISFASGNCSFQSETNGIDICSNIKPVQTSGSCVLYRACPTKKNFKVTDKCRYECYYNGKKYNCVGASDLHVGNEADVVHIYNNSNNTIYLDKLLVYKQVLGAKRNYGVLNLNLNLTPGNNITKYFSELSSNEYLCNSVSWNTMHVTLSYKTTDGSLATMNGSDGCGGGAKIMLIFN